MVVFVEASYASVRSKSMPDKLKTLRIFTESGRLIALAVAAAMVLGTVGPTWAQFFNFGGFQQRPQPQRGGRRVWWRLVCAVPAACTAASLEWAANVAARARGFFEGADARET